MRVSIPSRLIPATLLLAAAPFVGSGCSEVGAVDRPLRLHLVVEHEVPATPLELETLIEFVESYVSVELHGVEGQFHLEGRIHSSRQSLLAEFVGGGVDLGVLPAVDFMQLPSEAYAKFTPIVSEASARPEPAEVAHLITPTSSSARQLSDLRGLRVAWSSALTPAANREVEALLERWGIALDQRIECPGDESVAELLGEQEAEFGVVTGATSGAELFHIVAELPEQVDNPWVLRRVEMAQDSTGAKLAKAVQGAILSFAAAPEGRQVLQGLLPVQDLKPVEPAEYETLRDRRRGLDVD